MKKKFLNKKTSIRMMIVGGITYGLSLVLSFITLFQVYGQSAECLDGATCDLASEQLMSRIALIAGYAGAAVALVGLVIFVVLSTRKKK